MFSSVPDPCALDTSSKLLTASKNAPAHFQVSSWGAGAPHPRALVKDLTVDQHANGTAKKELSKYIYIYTYI